MLISPPECFDFQRNLQYKVFNLQSHCIFVILHGLRRARGDDLSPRDGARCRRRASAPSASACPRFSSRSCRSGATSTTATRPAIGSATTTATTSWRHGPQRGLLRRLRFRPLRADLHGLRGKPAADALEDAIPRFDRRDVTVITQNALCDTYYSQYIRQQYDPRFRPKPADYTPFEKWLGPRPGLSRTSPVTLPQRRGTRDCWTEYAHRPEVAARIKAGRTAPPHPPRHQRYLRVNGIAAQKIFEKNKKDHTFYLEQSVPMTGPIPTCCLTA